MKSQAGQGVLIVAFGGIKDHPVLFDRRLCVKGQGFDLNSQVFAIARILRIHGHIGKRGLNSGSG